MNDSELIDKIIQGDKKAFEVLMNKYSPVLSAYLFRRIDSEQDREDLLQEIFIKAYTHMGTLRNPKRLGAWLTNIASNGVKDAYRNRSRRIIHVPAYRSDSSLPNPSSEIPDPTLTDTGSLDTILIIQNTIKGLKEKYSTVLYLHYIQELNSSEIAHLLNLRTNTVRMRIKRGSEQLRTKLSKNGITLDL